MNLDYETQRELRQIDMIRAVAEMEWEPLSKTDYSPLRNKYRCTRCNRPLMHVRFIRNKITDEEYPVGTECIQHIEDLFRMHGIDLNLMQKQDERIRRAQEVDDDFPDIKFLIDNWREVFDKNTITIPKHLEMPFISAKLELESVYQDCLDKGVSVIKLDTIRSILSDRNRLIQDILIYLNCNADNEWAGTIKIEQWLTRRKITSIYNKLKETGIVDDTTAGFILEPNFMKLIGDRLRIVFNHKGIAGWQPRVEQEGYLIKISPFEIRLICNHQKVINFYWDKIRSENECEDYSLGQLLDISKIYSKDYQKVEKELRKRFLGSKLSIHSMSYERDEVIFREKNKNDRFLKYRYIPFMELSKPLVFNSPQVNLDYIEQKILSTSSKRYTRNEIMSLEGFIDKDIHEIKRRSKKL